MEQNRVIRHRSPLRYTKHKLQKDKFTIGFLGGSITEAAPSHNWPEPVIAWFAETYPNIRFIVENAAIGATGSDLAVFRAKRDILDRGCDLVFVEYAVNDYFEPVTKRIRSREGLIRQLKAAGIEVVLVYTFIQDMYNSMIAGDVPESIAEWERIADHYGIGSVWMGQYALDEVRRGLMRWEEWLPDGLHPTSRGSLCYAQSVISYLRTELMNDFDSVTRTDVTPLVDPLHELTWDNVELLPISRITGSGSWVIRRTLKSCWYDQLLCTSAVGATLAFQFQGRGLVLGFDFGLTSSEFRYRIDEGEWLSSDRDRPEWCPDNGWFRPILLADGLQLGDHLCELEVVHGNQINCKGTQFHLAFIGLIK